jgi:hypothetical protein
LEAAAL